MSIICNNTTIDIIKYNGNNIDSVKYNGTEVYVSTRTLTVNIGDYITSIIINGTTYNSNTTLSIKPGTSVTLNCNIQSNTNQYSYGFSNWTGYTTNTSKSFTFTMPNSNVTYTANGIITTNSYTITFNANGGNSVSSITKTYGTTITLPSCSRNSSSSTSNGLTTTTTYSFKGWYSSASGGTSYGNSGASYTITGNVTMYAQWNTSTSTSFSWPYFDNIPEATFLAALNSNASNKYDAALLGSYVTLTEGSTTHNWLIIRVNRNSYDLWYAGIMGTAKWAGKDEGRFWTNNSSTNTNLVRGLCNDYKSKLSSGIQAKLKTGLNANCGDDLVVILSARQLGCTESSVDNDDNSAIRYFNSIDSRKIGSYWTSSTDSNYSNSLWSVKTDGTLTTTTTTTACTMAWFLLFV